MRIEISSSSSIEILGNHILKYALPAGSALDNCLAFVCNGKLLFRSGPIDTQQKLSELLALVQRIWQGLDDDSLTKRQPIRFASMQLNWIDEDWDLIQNQHLMFVKNQQANIPFAHLCFPSNHAFLRRDPREISEFMTKSLNQLGQQFNHEAWLAYALWLNEDAEKVLQTFQPEASEEYQLQGLLEDLGHEVRSPLLETLRHNISNAMLEKDAALAQGKREGIYGFEKTIISGREHLKESVEVICELCSKITEGITKIEIMHPELRPLKYEAILLYTLMKTHLSTSQQKSWGKRLLLIELLDEAFGVISQVNCDTGVERTNLVFCIRLALMEMKGEFFFDDLVKLCMDWDEEGTSMQAMRSRLAALFLANLKLLGIPSNQTTKQAKHPPTELWGANRDLLTFFPDPLEIGKGGKDFYSGIIIDKDPQTGKSLGFTEEGRQFLRRLSVM